MAQYTPGTCKQVGKSVDGGGIQTIYRQWITTELGNTGYIDVKPSDWNAKKLREILDRFADELDLAHNLG